MSQELCEEGGGSPGIHCGPECAWIFDRILIFPLIKGGTRVEWGLHPQFKDPPPYTFQLQVGSTGNPLADDWADVGSPVTDTFFMEDPQQRLWGMMAWTHYRVLLTTPLANYASPPQLIWGTMDRSDAQKAKALVRQTYERLVKVAGVEGYLLKRRLYGEACSCLDTMTLESRRPDCPICYGTGIVKGYFDPYPCFYVEFSGKKIRSHVSDTGTTNDGPVVAGRMINTPQIHSYDVWVDRGSDQRWFIHRIESETEIRGIPIILHPVEMRMAPFSHIIYSFPIPGQIP